MIESITFEHTLTRHGIAYDLTVVAVAEPGSPGYTHCMPGDGCAEEGAIIEIWEVLHNGTPWEHDLTREDTEELEDATLEELT